MPQNTFVGKHEDVPGLQEEFFPHPRPDDRVLKTPEWQVKQENKAKLEPVPKYISSDIKLMPMKTLYLHNLTLSDTSVIESAFQTYLRKMELQLTGE